MIGYAGDPIYFQAYVHSHNTNPPQCECHECTQARWRMSIQGQMHGPIGAPKYQVGQISAQAGRAVQK